MKITNAEIEVSKLIPYVNNARTHTEQQINSVAASINEFGFTNPILVDSKNNLIAGHCRLLAAQKLGLEKVPARVIDGLSATQKKALVLADNRLAEIAAWDDDLLKLELQALVEDEYDLNIVGFDDEALLDLLEPEQVEGLTDEDDVPEPPAQPVARLGDVWLLGQHRLMCGDSTSIDQIERLMNGQLADLWLTDPPYNVAYTGKTKDAMTIQNDSMGNDEFRQFLRDCYSAADTVMRQGAVFYIAHADSEGFNFRGAAFDVGWQVRPCLIWAKSSIVMGRQDYHWQHEPILYGWKDGAAHQWENDRKQSTLLKFDRPSRNGEHPTMKPVELIEYLMCNNTKPKQLVLDSFGGSGTTLIAAEKNNRIAYLMELDPKYVDVIVKRWQDYTGKDAIHEQTQLTFTEHAQDNK